MLFRSVAGRNRQVRGAKYYALLKLDGDEMGRWLSGENSPQVGEVLHPKIRSHHLASGNQEVLEGVKRPVTPGLHAAISERLTQFAVRIVPEVVRESGGELIYSGGDDVLAMLPADTALECAVRLRMRFSSDDVMGARVSASAGLVFAHYLEDLRNVLAMARLLEKRAKAEGRNRICIAAMRRSGEHAVAGCAWEYVARIDAMRSRFLEGATDRWAYQLRAQLPVLSGLPVEAFGTELVRLMKRSESRSGLQELAVESLRDYLGQHPKTPLPVALADFVTLCQTASFLARPGGEL